MPPENVMEQLSVTQDEGLTDAEVRQRRSTYGSNTLRETKRRGKLMVLFDQFKSLLVALLALAAVVALAYDERLQGISILAVLLINALIGFVTETRAISSMEALRKMTRINAYVRREGSVREVPSSTLVPGDIVVLHAGDLVPADARVVESSKLQTDESTLTGESMPVSKSSEGVEPSTVLADRTNMLYKGTFLTRGTAEAVVVATGMETELGKISASIGGVEEEKTPLEKKLDELAQKLIPLLVIVAAIVGVTGYFRGIDPLLMVQEAIALAIATVPEGLPIVATLVLARGMMRMADHNVLINKLSSVETLGSTTIVCTDKTGTLTENKMTVTAYELYDRSVRVTGTGLEIAGSLIDEATGERIDDDHILRWALEVGVLCNNAEVSCDGGIGDPMEVALLVAGRKAGLERESLIETMPEELEVSFDPSVKMMATYHDTGEGYVVAVKGAPEEVLSNATGVATSSGVRELTPGEQAKWRERADEMASRGLRVLALARKTTYSTDVEPYEGLTLVGLAGMMDPPRKEVRPAIERCRRAGMRVVMVTGDHAATAVTIAQGVGLIDTPDVDVVHGHELADIKGMPVEELQRFIDAPIFARVTPEDKLDIIEVHQRNASIVAMTGDGVNDAPALKKADIGVAMGKRGTQVAREASDMILQDDDFTSIVQAVKEGRIIFGNIRKFVIYLISCNLSELLAILIASIIGMPLPLLPLQILFLNVVNDVFPAFALGACRASEGIMERPPRSSDEPVLTRTNWGEMGYYGLLIAAATVGAYALSSGTDAERVTVSFLTLAFAQLWHVFSMREVGSGILKNEVTENAYVWGALVLSSMLLFASVYVGGFSTALGTQPPDADNWIIVGTMSLVPLVGGQLERVVRARR
jgi:Ca2+-transporting ATPase